MINVNNKTTTVNILNLQYLSENTEGLMSVIVTDVVEHIYIRLSVLFKAMWRMSIVWPEGLLLGGDLILNFFFKHPVDMKCSLSFPSPFCPLPSLKRNLVAIMCTRFFTFAGINGLSSLSV